MAGESRPQTVSAHIQWKVPADRAACIPSQPELLSCSCAPESRSCLIFRGNQLPANSKPFSRPVCFDAAMSCFRRHKLHKHCESRTKPDFVVPPLRHTMLSRLGESDVDASAILRSARRRSATLLPRCFDPTPSICKPIEGPVAQRSEQRTHNPLVVGSNPTRPTISIYHIINHIESANLQVCQLRGEANTKEWAPRAGDPRDFFCGPGIPATINTHS